jgi:AraC-like DNA-binding protein
MFCSFGRRRDHLAPNMTRHAHDEAHHLFGLDIAIRLKADLLHRMCTNDASRWTKDVLRFVTALERSHLTDRTALVVLLTELREQLRLLLGAGARRIETGETAVTPLVHEVWASLPRHEILTRFKEETIGALLPAASPHALLSPIVRRAKRIIDERFADPLTLDCLAAAVGRSKRQLASVFRQELAMTAHEYLTRVRLRRALDLIRNEEKIEAVSLLVGYRSKKNLYHHFKTRVGLTPIAYRAALFGIDRPS